MGSGRLFSSERNTLFTLSWMARRARLRFLRSMMLTQIRQSFTFQWAQNLPLGSRQSMPNLYWPILRASSPHQTFKWTN